MRGRAFAGRNQRHKRSPVFPDSDHAENKRYQHRDQCDGKEGGARLLMHGDQRVDRACQHRLGDELLRRPHDLWRDPGEEIDEYPARGGGDQSDGDRGEDPKPVIERFMRSQYGKPRQRE